MVLRLLPFAFLVVAASLSAQDTVPARKRVPLAVQALKKPQGPAGWLGFRHTAKSDSLVVLEVAPGSPAERAGLRTGDWITMVEDRIATRQLLLDNPLMVGDSRRLTVQRGAEVLTLEMVAVSPPPGTLKTRVTVATADTVAAEARLLRTKMARQATRVPMPASADTAVSSDVYTDLVRVMEKMKHGTGQDLRAAKGIDSVTYQELERTLKRTDQLLVTLKAGTKALAGAEFEQLNPGLAEYFGGVSDGMFVLRVAAGTPAATAGLQPGDIIETLNGERVETIAALRASIAESSGPLTLHVIRKGRPATVVLRKE